jgi:hypothetical protein
VTLNFDTAIETAFERYGNPYVCVDHAAYQTLAAFNSPLRIHKLHGTLSGDRDDPPTTKYRTVKYTVQRIGTALDESLIDWLRDVIANRSVLITGYSGADLDVFPALQHALGQGDVYWNSRHEPSYVTNAWLRRLRHRCQRVPGDIADVFDHLALRLELDLEPHDTGTTQYTMSLGHLERDVRDAVGTLLAAAIACHNTEQREHAAVRDAIVACLHKPRVRPVVDRDPRQAVLLRRLAAAPQHERGNIWAALEHFREARSRVQHARRKDVRLPELAEPEIEVNIAYNEAWPLKRFDAKYLVDARGIPNAVRGVAKLLWWTLSPSVRNPALRSGAAHHLAETPLTWGLACDVVAPGNPIAWMLYLLARTWFKVSWRDGRMAQTHGAFRMMRLSEVDMNIARTRPFGRGVRDEQVVHVDRTLEHCRYLNGEPELWHRTADGRKMQNGTGAMDGDAAAGVHLILEAARGQLRGRSGIVRKRLHQAWEIFKDSRYGSGFYRTQMYAWILCNRGSWLRNVAAAPGRLRRARALRAWFSDERSPGASGLFPCLVDADDATGQSSI